MSDSTATVQTTQQMDRSRSRRVRPTESETPTQFLADTYSELQNLQRQRAALIKFRVMNENRLCAMVAGSLGYSTNLKESERRKLFTQAAAVVKAVAKGKSDHPFANIIKLVMAGVADIDVAIKDIGKQMETAAAKLPVAAWIKQPEQRGLSLGYLGVIIGETGDLSNYANPGKVWRRLGCAPWQFNGETRMGATWKGKKLPAEEWTKFGYSSRRRSVAWLIGTNMVKQNFLDRIGFEAEMENVEDAAETTHVTEGCFGRRKSAGVRVGANEESTANGIVGDPGFVTDVAGADELDVGDYNVETDSRCARIPGPYRLRYDEAKVTFKERHPDAKPAHCANHAMLLATKLVLKNLWIEWHKLVGGLAAGNRGRPFGSSVSLGES